MGVKRLAFLADKDGALSPPVAEVDGDFSTVADDDGVLSFVAEDDAKTSPRIDNKRTASKRAVTMQCILNPDAAFSAKTVTHRNAGCATSKQQETRAGGRGVRHGEEGAQKCPAAAAAATRQRGVPVPYAASGQN